MHHHHRHHHHHHHRHHHDHLLGWRDPAAGCATHLPDGVACIRGRRHPLCCFGFGSVALLATLGSESEVWSCGSPAAWAGKHSRSLAANAAQSCKATLLCLLVPLQSSNIFLIFASIFDPRDSHNPQLSRQAVSRQYRWGGDHSWLCLRLGASERGRVRLWEGSRRATPIRALVCLRTPGQDLLREGPAGSCT